MCARRSDLIAIGGADEHIDFLGHVCGPYEMTFRLVNRGLSEVWHRHEFLYHTWHPGQAGADNYLGPHDGRQVSTTALDALTSGRVLPLLENASIRRLREESGSQSRQEEFVISADYRSSWRHESLRVGKRWLQGSVRRDLWHGFVVEPSEDGFRAYPRVFGHPSLASRREAFEVQGASLEIVRDRLHRALPWTVHVALPLAGAVTFFARALGMGYLFLRRRIARKLRR